MQAKDSFKLCLIGNPNSGKTSLFNTLTGLNQKVGNYPGVTVEKKIGNFSFQGYNLEIVDLPGVYSLYPNSSDERIVLDILTDSSSEHFPDLAIVVIDSQNIDKHFLIASQMAEFDIPTIVVFSMVDLSDQKEIFIDTKLISDYLGCEVLGISSRTGLNIELLKEKIIKCIELGKNVSKSNNSYDYSEVEKRVVEKIVDLGITSNEYTALLIAHHYTWLKGVNNITKKNLDDIVNQSKFEPLKLQIRETMQRFSSFERITNKAVTSHNRKTLSEKIDAVITHKVLGPFIFFSIMLLVFQAIYSWSEGPMDFIEGIFIRLGETVSNILPSGWYTDLITEGIIAGLAGIMVFIPQIAILFFLISILEEVGYMSRVVFMFDGLMQKFGLNGRSVVALISGGACAIPAIMSTRSIANWKERLITIMVTPLISCSARIPVYTVLIGFVVSDTLYWGPFRAQGLAFMGLYLLGIIAALLSALVFKLILKSSDPSFMIMQLPKYKKPQWSSIFLTIKEKVTNFIVEAGKVVMVISIILWFLVSYGPGDSMRQAELQAIEQVKELNNGEDEALNNYVASKKIEASYAGIFGKRIEPFIEPLGYDWKIGIALLTSFAAREVFVSTMSTIYSVGSDNQQAIKDRLAQAINPSTGRKTYGFGTSLSLLLFYVFAMQCMGTLAVTKKETNSWKWPIIQFLFMSALAYLSALLAYQIFG